jgi:PTH1 family peptidyl-tRNA hydrolase
MTDHTTMPIQLIVGLGNPGNEYADTRHNAGFWWLEELRRRAGATWKKDASFQGQWCKVTLHGQTVYLLQPMTFMNRSGASVQALMRFFKLEPAQVLVAHDELDLPAGQLKLKRGGGSAGHNGLKDISQKLATPDYWRLRIGIGHPGDRQQVADYVLHPPRKEEHVLIEQGLWGADAILPDVLAGQFERAMLNLHTRNT